MPEGGGPRPLDDTCLIKSGKIWKSWVTTNAAASTNTTIATRLQSQSTEQINVLVGIIRLYPLRKLRKTSSICYAEMRLGVAHMARKTPRIALLAAVRSSLVLRPAASPPRYGFLASQFAYAIVKWSKIQVVTGDVWCQILISHGATNAEGSLSQMKFQHSNDASYRPDIDGLRALAVCAVVLFHAFPSIMPGALSVLMFSSSSLAS